MIAFNLHFRSILAVGVRPHYISTVSSFPGPRKETVLLSHIHDLLAAQCLQVGTLCFLPLYLNLG